MKSFFQISPNGIRLAHHIDLLSEQLLTYMYHFYCIFLKQCSVDNIQGEFQKNSSAAFISHMSYHIVYHMSSVEDNSYLSSLLAVRHAPAKIK